tara:strand:+ start:1283 stop:1465 length:183 start_codon:yes stop_codon:yes gene_type:complete
MKNMIFDIIWSYFQSISLVTVGLLMKISKNKEWTQGMYKYWIYFVLMGVILLMYEVLKTK